MSFMDYLRHQATLPEHLRDVPKEETAEGREAKEADFERRLQEDIDANNERRSAMKYIQDATEAIRGTICETMPTTAAANGMIDPLPTRADAAAILDGPHGSELQALRVGLSALLIRLSDLRISYSKAMARAVREEIIRRDMASAN